MDPAITEALGDLRDQLVTLYGQRLEALVVMGLADGTDEEEADVKVAVVLEGEVDPEQELDRMGEAIVDISVEHDILVDLVPIASSEWQG